MPELNFDNGVTATGSSALSPAVSLSDATGNAAASGMSELDQSDFIQLLIAQVENQDPTKPLEPSQFMNQLAQFSTVNGIKDLNSSFNALADKLSADQPLKAANLVGRNVLIPASQGWLTSPAGLKGELDLSQSTSHIDLKIMNDQGALIRQLPLGGHTEGAVQFQWDGMTDAGTPAPDGRYHIVAEALIGGKLQALPVELETRVNSITLNQDGRGTQLNLANGESIDLAAVRQIR